MDGGVAKTFYRSVTKGPCMVFMSDLRELSPAENISERLLVYPQF